ncbi:putative transporter [Thioalkalivibrio sp. HK1]|uniref:putative transporter n=1 Tax=Thioalkalivibrio sp. HK1 TaxID=1469245 RepID=UPI0009E0AE82|nr:putative transporter [Thioalkalivibrio sp. HK1]
MFRSFFLSRKWLLWAYPGAVLIIVTTWGLVQVDKWINEWYGDLFDVIGKALNEPGSVEESDYYLHIADFVQVAAVYIVVAVLLHFFTSHYVFRWRSAMNDYYMSRWQELRHIEGAAQRVQEDTMLFAKIVESLSSYFLNTIMTLIVFIPLLKGLSEQITELPLIGAVDSSLVWVAILSAAIGTAIVGLAGYRLPGLEFNNQRVEAAYRKELVYGEDYEDRAQPPTAQELFSNVRRNYFRLYLHYLYFNVGKFSYLQASVVLPFIMLGPTIFSATVTLGFVQETIRAFNRVEDSFQYLVRSWDRIVELMSIYKRLKHFEMAIGDKDTSQTTPPLYPGDGGGN